MNEFAYIAEILTFLTKYGAVILFVSGLLMCCLLYLVWGLHSKLDMMKKEIIDLKKHFKGGKEDGEYS